MADEPAAKKARPAPVFSLGDRVEIVHFGPGKVTALRGPLGPGGAEVYRVTYRRKPRAGHIEVLGGQLRPAKRAERRGPVGGEPAAPAGA